MKFLFFCILSLGIFSCNIPKIMPQKQTLNTKQNLPQVLIRIKTLCIQSLNNVVFHKEIPLLYCIVLRIKHSGIIYLSDEYWIERQVKGKWIRIQNDFGSILMGKEIPAYSCINDYAKVFLKAGHYKFCNTAYSDDARIDNKKIVMKAYFEVKSCKHFNQDISHFRTNDLFYLKSATKPFNILLACTCPLLLNQQIN